MLEIELRGREQHGADIRLNHPEALADPEIELRPAAGGGAARPRGSQEPRRAGAR